MGKCDVLVLEAPEIKTALLLKCYDIGPLTGVSDGILCFTNRTKALLII